jgi:hypothetical protein
MNAQSFSGVALLGLALSCNMLSQTGAKVMVKSVAIDRPASAARAADEDTLRKLNEQLLTAHDHADVATLDRIESDDFTLSGDFGTVVKKAHLDRLREPTYKTESVNRQIAPQEIRLYGDVALITETDHARTADGTFNFQTSSVWVRAADSWRVVHVHYSAIAKN